MMIGVAGIVVAEVPPAIAKQLVNVCLVVCLPPTAFILFPYTTLFRSVLAAETLGRHRRHQRGVDAAREPDDHALDRKSTRLNSSHTVILYAVFCLKKKNDPRIPRRVSAAGTQTAPGLVEGDG